MGNGMNKILPGLFLGNLHDSKDQQQLTNNSITHIVSAFDSARPVLMDKKYLCLMVSDSATQDMTQHFSTAANFIHNARLNGGSVLVHCLAGVSRSTTLVIAYMMVVTGLGWKDCYSVVRKCRTCSNPNFGFQRQLLEFQYNGLIEERKKLLEKYPDSKSLCESDGEMVQKILKENKEEEERERKKVEEEDREKEWFDKEKESRNNYTEKN